MAGSPHQELQQRIGYAFEDASLLRSALTHPSAVNAKSRYSGGASYERLEFLGDRVLGLVVAELLIERFPAEDEGALSKRLVALVRKEALLDVARRVALGDEINLAKGEGRAFQRQKETAAADGVEALIGAMFLDGGYPPAQAFIRTWWTPILDAFSAPPLDPKTSLQEWAQGLSLPLPAYSVVEMTGPDHQPRFVVAVSVEGRAEVRGEGRSKRAAEKAAAAAMLAAIGEAAE